MLARLLVAALTVAYAAADAYCPALSPDDSAPLSTILKDVCKRGRPGDGGVDCSDIPGLLEALAAGSGDESFTVALKAADFMCDACLDSIRDGLIYVGDEPASASSPKITPEGAVKSACGCQAKYSALANIVKGDVQKQWKNVEAACKKDDTKAVGASTILMMKSLLESLKTVKEAAMGGGMFLEAERRARAPQSFGSSAAMRAAAYGCLALGTALLVAAAVISRRPAEAAQESELL